MFVSIHLLRSYPTPHLPNRGEDGLAKRATFGGVERQRISAQCQKAALRHGDAMIDLANRVGQNMSLRSGSDLITERLVAMLADLGEDAEAWGTAAMALWRKEGKEAQARKDDDDDKPAARGSRAAPLVVGEQELALLGDCARAFSAAGYVPKQFRDLVTKKLPKDAPEGLAGIVAAFKAARGAAGFDGSLFGRFATGESVSTVDAAVVVADALSVHPIRSEADFFSAMDDLRREKESSGASHIGTRELTSGVFYHSVTIDLEQVKRNLGCDDATAVEVASGMVEAIYLTEPLGAVRATSSVEEMLVEVSDRQPLSHAGAFETPLETTTEARSSLAKHVADRDLLDGAPANRFWLRDVQGSGPAYKRVAAALNQALTSSAG